MQWFLANLPQVLNLTGYHLIQAVVPLVLSVLIAIPLAQLARINKVASGIILSAGSLLYTVPSLALFVILPSILGTKILDFSNIIVALTIYAVALLGALHPRRVELGRRHHSRIRHGHGLPAVPALPQR